MDLKDLLTALHVGNVDHDLTVETTGAQQCGVKYVGAVRCRNEHDRIVRLETVHLNEQLVQGLFALIVTAAKTCATLTTDCIDLVDEDDGRS